MSSTVNLSFSNDNLTIPQLPIKLSKSLLSFDIFIKKQRITVPWETIKVVLFLLSLAILKMTLYILFVNPSILSPPYFTK